MHAYDPGTMSYVQCMPILWTQAHLARKENKVLLPELGIRLSLSPLLTLLTPYSICLTCDYID